MSHTYIVLNKPVDCQTGSRTPGVPHVLDLVEEDQKGLIVINELPADAEGLVLLSTDALLKNKTQDELPVVFDVIIDQELEPKAKGVLEKGMLIDGAFFPGIRIKRAFNKGKRTVVTVKCSVVQGKDLATMFFRLGYHVHLLRCVGLGKLQLGVLGVGQLREVKRQEISASLR